MHNLLRKLRYYSSKDNINYLRKFSVTSVKGENPTISRFRFRQIKDTKSKGRPISPGEYALLVSINKLNITTILCH